MLLGSVPDPRCFDTEQDPYHWIRILLFFTGAFKVPPKIIFFFSKFFCLILTVGTFTSIYKDSKLLRSKKPKKWRFFVIYLFFDGRIWIGTNNYKSGSVRPKNLRIRNTGCRALRTVQVYVISSETYVAGCLFWLVCLVFDFTCFNAFLCIRVYQVCGWKCHCVCVTVDQVYYVHVHRRIFVN